MAKAVLQERRTTPLVPMQCFDPDERQIPMGLGWPIMFGSLENRGDLGLLFADDAFCNNRLERRIIAVNTRWQPERDPNPSSVRCAAPAANELLPRARNSRGMCNRY